MSAERWTAPMTGSYHFVSGMPPHLTSECTEACHIIGGSTMSVEMVSQIQEGVAEAERGKTRNLGSFAQYLDGDAQD